MKEKTYMSGKIKTWRSSKTTDETETITKQNNPHSRDGRYQNFDVDTISICKDSIYQLITIFITVWTFNLNLCKCIKYTAFCFNFFVFWRFEPLKTATLWTLLLSWLTTNLKKNLIEIYIL